MIDTNGLLSFALAAVSTFTNSVQVPPHTAPAEISDLQAWVVGSPSSKIEVCITAKNGSRFGIRDGAVDWFHSKGSFFETQDFSSIERYLGECALKQEECLPFATRMLRRLVKSGDPLATCKVYVQRASSYQGKPIPFFRVTWCDTNWYSMSVAELEVDARSATIVAVGLHATNFFDPALAQEITDRVYTPDPVVPQQPDPPRKRVLPYPSKAQSEKAIANWLLFCEKVGVATGGADTVEQINWEKSFLYVHPRVSTTSPVCRITFTNGGIFESVDGVVLDHFCPDSCFFNDYIERRAWTNFQGRVEKRWEDLATALEGRLSDSLGIPKAVMDQLRPFVHNQAAAPGKVGLTRTVIQWRQWIQPTHEMTDDELPLVFMAEFDLQNGETKWVNLFNPGFLGLIPSARAAQH
jgi:hypothetical protein